MKTVSLIAIIGGFVLMAMASPAFAEKASGKETVTSGNTQVVAQVGSREITLSELRLEMAELGLSPDDPSAERTALESLTNRVALAYAARKAKFHRKPQTIARMYAAQDKALADMYLATAARPPEPTRSEIEAYIKANPSLFSEREIYDFYVLALESDNFDEGVLLPYFDKESDFSKLTTLLDEAGAAYDLAVSTRTSNQFPAPIRKQLASYGARDNIVLKGAAQTQILKIIAKRPAPLDDQQFGVFARQNLLREQAERRAERFLESVRADAGVDYFRASASPSVAESG